MWTASHSIGQSLAIWQNCHICLRILYSQVHSVVTHLMHSMCRSFVTVYRLYWSSSLKATHVQVRVKEYGKKYNHPAMTSKTKILVHYVRRPQTIWLKEKISSKCQLSLLTPTHFFLSLSIPLSGLCQGTVLNRSRSGFVFYYVSLNIFSISFLWC